MFRKYAKDGLIMLLSLACAFVLSMVFQYIFDVREHITTVFVFAVFLIALMTEGYLYGVLDSLSATAQNVLANLITIFLGISVAFNMTADKFLQLDTLLIMGLGLIAFIVDTAGGILFAKLLNMFMKTKVNPMIGAAGISAFPMSGRTGELPVLGVSIAQ